MDENLIKIKNQILSELGFLNYMAKNKIPHDLDKESIEKELAAIKKTRKYRILAIVLILIGFTCLELSVVYDKGPLILRKNLMGTITSFIVFLSIIILYIKQKIENIKKETLFKILSVFNK